MQRLLWIGSPFFSASLEECGWQMHAHNFEEVAVFSWADLVRLAGWEPDVLVVADKSRPPFVLGMEDFPCLTVFYCVDSHIHSWYPYYAQGFDICLVSLRDHMPALLNKRLTDRHVWWFPPYARNTDAPDPSRHPQWDCLFVGSTDPRVLPKRARFLEALGRRVPSLHVTKGDYRTQYGLGRVLINQSEGGDLNFRVFEALGCGGCLVTPRVGHGLNELFVDGEQLVMYAPDTPEDAATKIKLLLDDPELTAYIAEKGLHCVNANHRARHRAETFTDRLCDIWMDDPSGMVMARQAAAAEIRERWLRMPYLLLAEKLPFPLLKKAYLEATKGLFGRS